MNSKSSPRQQLASGVPGLDVVLRGGLIPSRLYLVEGASGTGKSTLALQFMIEGLERGETGVYLTLGETKDELEETADSHGWSLKGVTFCESVVSEESLKPEEQYTMFPASEARLNETTRQLMDAVERVKPARVVIDALTELRLLAQSAFRHHEQVAALKRYFTQRHCTVLMLDDLGSAHPDCRIETLAHGLILLEQMPPEFGAERRRMRVAKMRGKEHSLGYHDFIIRRGGIEVFPRLVAAEHPADFEQHSVLSGIKELDALLGGGLPAGTSTLLMGTAGVGKSSIAQQYAAAAAAGGESAAIFTFEESIRTMLVRSDAFGLNLRSHIETGRIVVEQVDPGQMSPGEFTAHVRRVVDRADEPPAKVVVIDSLNGYLNAMPEERFLLIQLHELLNYLGQRGVVTLLVMAQRGLVGSAQIPVETTYLADGVLYLRFFEAAGETRLAISAVKMRNGAHERTIREMQLGKGGIRIGEPLRQFQGILSGEPTFLGQAGPLMGPSHGESGTTPA